MHVVQSYRSSGVPFVLITKILTVGKVDFARKAFVSRRACELSTSQGRSQVQLNYLNINSS